MQVMNEAEVGQVSGGVINWLSAGFRDLAAFWNRTIQGGIGYELGYYYEFEDRIWYIRPDGRAIRVPRKF